MITAVWSHAWDITPLCLHWAWSAPSKTLLCSWWHSCNTNHILMPFVTQPIGSCHIYCTTWLQLPIHPNQWNSWILSTPFFNWMVVQKVVKFPSLASSCAFDCVFTSTARKPMLGVHKPLDSSFCDKVKETTMTSFSCSWILTCFMRAIGSQPCSSRNTNYAACFRCVPMLTHLKWAFNRLLKNLRPAEECRDNQSMQDGGPQRPWLGTIGI